jgi:NitT/TauT family transport system substrate-binding protein
VDEKDLWDNGQFATTILVVNKSFLDEHPETVRALLKGHIAAVRELQQEGTAAADTLNEGLKASAGAALPADVLTRSLASLQFTVDPLAGTYAKLLQDGVDAGTTKAANLNGIFDLAPLNAELLEMGLPTVTAAGLGTP